MNEFDVVVVGGGAVPHLPHWSWPAHGGGSPSRPRFVPTTPCWPACNAAT